MWAALFLFWLRASIIEESPLASTVKHEKRISYVHMIGAAVLAKSTRLSMYSWKELLRKPITTSGHVTASLAALLTMPGSTCKQFSVLNWHCRPSLVVGDRIILWRLTSVIHTGQG